MTSRPIPKADSAGAFSHFKRDQIGFFEHMARTYGDIVQYNFLWVKIVQVSHPDLIQAILVANADKVEKSALDHVVFTRLLGQGLLNSEGDFHRRQRKLIQPAFHHKRIEAYATVTTDFAADMVQDWRDGDSFDMHDAMTRLTLYVVSKVLYDADVRDAADSIGESVHTLSHEGEEIYTTGFALPMWIPTRQNRVMRQAVNHVDSVILPIIEKRRASGDDRGDLLSMLLAAQDEETGIGMSDQQVRDEAMSLFLAGHETTSNALAWTWYLLSRNPDAAARLHAELDTVLGGRTPTLADLPRLKYTDWVIKEAMRLFPPAWTLNGRTPTEDLTIDGYTVPKGCVIYISPWVMHHDARYFPDPYAFKPERWDNDFEKSIPRYAYFPFGGGPRVCIGNSFASMEARLIVATIAQRFHVEIDPAHEVVQEPLITLRPKDGLPVTLRERVPQFTPGDLVTAGA